MKLELIIKKIENNVEFRTLQDGEWFTTGSTLPEPVHFAELKTGDWYLDDNELCQKMGNSAFYDVGKACVMNCVTPLDYPVIPVKDIEVKVEV